MMKNLLTVIAVGLLSFSAMATEISPLFSKNSGQFQADVNAGRPVLVVFSASWCGPCNNMKRNVWNTQKFSNLVNSYDFTPYYMDTDANQALVRKYGISSIPAVRYFNGGSKGGHGSASFTTVNSKVQSTFSRK